jgi:hypothetical protein
VGPGVGLDAVVKRKILNPYRDSKPRSSTAVDFVIVYKNTGTNSKEPNTKYYYIFSSETEVLYLCMRTDGRKIRMCVICNRHGS